jgi:Flp pilus assembly protein TadG
MTPKLRSLSRASDGATAVEFAFTMPLFLALLIGGVQLGLALWTQFGLEYGAEAAARCGSITPATCSSSTQIASYAASHAFGLPVTSSNFTVSAAGCGNQVSGSYAYNLYTIIAGTKSITLSARACFPS